MDRSSRGRYARSRDDLHQLVSADLERPYAPPRYSDDYDSQWIVHKSAELRRRILASGVCHLTQDGVEEIGVLEAQWEMTAYREASDILAEAHATSSSRYGLMTDSAPGSQQIAVWHVGLDAETPRHEATSASWTGLPVDAEAVAASRLGAPRRIPESRRQLGENQRERFYGVTAYVSRTGTYSAHEPPADEFPTQTFAIACDDPNEKDRFEAGEGVAVASEEAECIALGVYEDVNAEFNNDKLRAIGELWKDVLARAEQRVKDVEKAVRLTVRAIDVAKKELYTFDPDQEDLNDWLFAIADEVLRSHRGWAASLAVHGSQQSTPSSPRRPRPYTGNRRRRETIQS